LDLQWGWEQFELGIGLELHHLRKCVCVVLEAVKVLFLTKKIYKMMVHGFSFLNGKMWHQLNTEYRQCLEITYFLFGQEVSDVEGLAVAVDEVCAQSGG
jgi:hypothetical protein